MKPHLLYIAFWYPPSRASGVYRALATTREFVAAGWDVTVITCDRPFLEDEVGSVDESLLKETPLDIDVIRVPFTFDLAADLDVRSLNWWSANFPTLWDGLHRKIAPIRNTVSAALGTHPTGPQFTDGYQTWIDPVVKAGVAVDARHRVDHVLATGNPYSSFEAARILAADLGTGYSVDYRDPWTIDVFTGSTNYADRATLAAEKRIVEQAASCFHVNDAIAEAYRRLYPHQAHKQIVVYNGYDAQSIPAVTDPASPPYRFGILGTMNDRWPMDAILKAWKASLPQLPAGSELLLGGHLGYFARSQDVLEATLPSEDVGFRYVGPVHKADVADFYASIDIVVVPVPGGPMVTSGKVFEALALGKPIVCVQQEGGGARGLLNGHPLAIAAEPTPKSVAPALLEAARLAVDFDPDTVTAIRKKYCRYERHVAMQPMVVTITGRLRGSDRE